MLPFLFRCSELIMQNVFLKRQFFRNYARNFSALRLWRPPKSHAQIFFFSFFPCCTLDWDDMSNSSICCSCQLWLVGCLVGCGLSTISSWEQTLLGIFTLFLALIWSMGTIRLASSRLCADLRGVWPTRVPVRCYWHNYTYTFYIALKYTTQC